MKVAKEEISSFFVISTTNEIMKVVVSQPLKINYQKDEVYIGKYFHLNKINGPEVYKTDDPTLFKLANGKILKRINRDALPYHNFRQ